MNSSDHLETGPTEPNDDLPIGQLSIGQLAAAHPDIVAELGDLDAIKTMATFAGLLTKPELQASCFRIEAAIHLAAAYCKGRATPTSGFVRRCFDRLGSGYCGIAEDPAEDVFISLVSTSRGNFRVLEGIRESTGFHLQRILNVVERMPEYGPFARIREAVGGLLKLSDEVAARACICENSLGHEMPVATLPNEATNKLALSRNLVRFDCGDLEGLQVGNSWIADFALDLETCNGLQEQSLGHTYVERRPLVRRGEFVHLVLPTAVGSAITRLVIETVLALDMADTLEQEFAFEFKELFRESPLLGEALGVEIPFARLAGGWMGIVMAEVDAGRFLHLVLFVDGVDRFIEDGLNGLNSHPAALSDAVASQIKAAAAHVSARSGFRDGISLVVGCGYGRCLRFALESALPDRWRFESVSAPDFVTLGWLQNFGSLSLWRLLDSLEAIQQQGVEVVNINGLLNLVAWSRQLEGHLVPHGELPDGFATPGKKSVLVVNQNAIRQLRHTEITYCDPRRVLDVDGRWVKVRKVDRTLFKEDQGIPLYLSEDDLPSGRLRGVYVAPRRPWWIEVSAQDCAPRGPVFEYWQMACTWLQRAAPILEEAFPSLPDGPFSFDVRFEKVTGDMSGEIRPKNADEIRALVSYSSEAGVPRVEITIGEGFEDGLAQAENVAERALVEALVAGAAGAAGNSGDARIRLNLVDEICPNTQARWMHRFEARSYRDFVRVSIKRRHLILIHPMDDAGYRIGLGWRIHSRESGSEISGIPECTAYLNNLVRVVLDDLCTSLNSLNRRLFLTAVLHNHEAAALDRDNWKRTTQANLALHDDQDDAIRTIVDHHSLLNSCFLSSRVLVEAAVCECPLVGGETPGRLDLSRLMTKAMLAFHLGGWSDAIHWGAMEPRIRVTPVGDIHMDYSFMDEVFEPFGRVGGVAGVKHAWKTYSRLYARPDTDRSAVDVFEPQFLRAWETEFGVSIEGMHAFIGKLEELGYQPPKALYELSRSSLAAILAEASGITVNEANHALDGLILAPRPAWRTASKDLTNKDWYPWRFGRRLSLLRRPFIQLESGSDPAVVVTPGIVRESFRALISWFHEGEISSAQAKSAEMARWIGCTNNSNRSEFNSIVANRMRELGWQAIQEIKLPRILGRPLDRDYGDIDVLAWRGDSNRVLAIECKDVQYHKALGGVAEQIADFRGEVRADGKPDHLRRHLDRLEVLRSHETSVAKALKLARPIEIEGHLVFRNPVPMRFAWEHMASKVRLSLFEELERL